MQGQANDWLTSNKIPQKLRLTMTDAELCLWQRLRHQQMGVKFRRQHPFENFVLDFVCLSEKLAIELDGGQHVELVANDAVRTALLEKAGFRVLRFWNNQVLTEMDAVLELIWLNLHPSPSQPPP